MIPRGFELQSGDLVFLAIPNPLYRRVALATGSKTSHVGIAFQNDDGSWQIAESTFPFSKYTPLERYLRRTENGWVCVRRIKGGLTDGQVVALRQESDRRMGIFYHLGFNYQSPGLFCSKLVFDVYRSALGVQVGELETFQAILEKQPSTSLTFWRFWFFGLVPWSRLTVTPASQLASTVFDTIFQST
jgi:hypothetical protein